MTRAKSICTMLVGIITSACGGDTLHQNNQHGNCVLVEYNSVWTGTYLKLVHSDDRDCPFSNAPGYQVTTSGTIYDESVASSVKPDTPTNGGDAAVATAYQSNLDGQLGQNTTYFAWGLGRSGTGMEWAWQAYSTVSYTNGDNPDFVQFKVHWINSGWTPATALMEVDYFGIQM